MDLWSRQFDCDSAGVRDTNTIDFLLKTFFSLSCDESLKLNSVDICINHQWQASSSGLHNTVLDHFSTLFNMPIRPQVIGFRRAAFFHAPSYPSSLYVLLSLHQVGEIDLLQEELELCRPWPLGDWYSQCYSLVA